MTPSSLAGAWGPRCPVTDTARSAWSVFSRTLSAMSRDEAGVRLEALGAKVAGKSVLAVFPLDVLSEQNEIHIVFDQRITSGATGCDDCSMRFKLSGVPPMFLSSTYSKLSTSFVPSPGSAGG